MRWCLWGDRPKASLTSQPPSLIVRKGDCLAGGWDQNQMEFWQPPLNGQTYLPLVPADRKGGGRGSATLDLTVSKCEISDLFFQWNLILWHRKHILTRISCPLSGCQNEGPASCKWWSGATGLLQMIIRRGQPLTNDHQEGPASCKWWSGGQQQ